jgi:hypothetical protein
MACEKCLPLLAAGVVALAPTLALAVDDVFTFGTLSVSVGVEAGAGGFGVKNPNFGLGRVDLVTGDNTGDSVTGEGYVEPSISFTYGADPRLSLFGTASAVATKTIGDGDAGGFTDGGDGDVDVELAFLGFKATVVDDPDNPWVLEVSGGRQNVQIGDGFLFWDGNFDTFGDGAFWLAPRTAYKLAGTADFSNGVFGVKPFYVQGDIDQDNTEIFGADIRVDTAYGNIGVLYGQVTDSDDRVFTRDGLELVSVRALGVGVPGLEDFRLSGEYTQQFGSKNGNDFNGDAYYAQADYTVSSLPWSPTFTYRYAVFSGDGNPGDSNVNAFDPLFYGFSSGWGTWFQGEIVGEYLLFNSNQRNHMAKISLAPTESLGVGLIYYHFDLDKQNYFGTPVTSRNFADEVNLYADWTISENVFISGVAGMAFSGKAAEQAFGNDQTTYLLQTYVVITF